MLNILEFNKILRYKGVKERLHRFLFLIVIGPLFSRLKRSMYSEMYPNRKGNLKKDSRTIFSEKSESNTVKSKNMNINLNVQYKKPIIRKCSNCGMIVASFVRKCPQCGKNIID